MNTTIFEKNKIKYILLKMVAFWNVTLCSLIDTDRRFRGADGGGIMSFETSVSI